ncbi:OmpA family protein [Desulfoferrobacter suflitae]|uniref:OmpA family protein n=1 Tax=Desulfoferrobacter suflitae TaxID=2865782 RepID=UPI002164C15E|nr:OmpA family protein [Desulfoferrobacter suflitae]MCK8602372.1 OmpA family protein [Desulfoferrobacter suflitae]
MSQKSRSLSISHHRDNPFSLSLGDLMAALTLIFALLMSATLLQLESDLKLKRELAVREEQTARKIQLIAHTYRRLQDELYQDLNREFREELNAWSAVIDRKSLSIRFREPEVFFGRGDTRIKETFKQILNSFFPRYIALLAQPRYRATIEEIRIEGHTSSEWSTDVDAQTAYIRNMRLSQDRTRSVLQYSLALIADPALKEWARSKITANGLSSSRQVMVDGLEDREASRRVEFRVRTDAEKRIGEILKTAK